MRRHFVFLLLCLCAFALAAPLPRKGTLGIQVRAMSAELQAKVKLGAQEGVEVVADGNGLKAGDVVTAINGNKFKTFGEWATIQRDAVGKEKATFTVLRDGKEEKIEGTVRPKTPDNGDNYETIYDEVISTGHRIRTFVTKPKSPGKHPVLVWIQGITASSIEFPLTAQSNTARVLKSFSDDGYVTVRVEKPGTGDSDGGPALLVGYDEELDIYRQALKALDKYDFVDRSRVYVFGHSMGGCHAPIVCAEIPVKGIITYGTVSDSWLEWQIKQHRVQGPLNGTPRSVIDKEVRETVAFYHYLYNEKKSIEWIKTNHPELKQKAEDSSADGVMLGTRSIQYMREVNDKNFCEFWPKIGNAKVLALAGEFDWISILDDQKQVADCVNAALPGQAVYRMLQGADHGFNKCTSMADAFSKWGKPGNEFNSDLLKMMKDWIKEIGE